MKHMASSPCNWSVSNTARSVGKRYLYKLFTCIVVLVLYKKLDRRLAK